MSTTRRHALKIVAFLLMLSAGVAIRAAIPVWAPTGSMTVARMQGLPFLLPDGRVMVVGGSPADTAGGSTDMFDPSTGTWTPGPPPANGHPQLAAGVRLPDGRILISGGRLDSGITVAAADIYDPSSNTWSRTQPMGRSRIGHTLTLLADGRVLAAGGYSFETGFDNTAEVYNPAAGIWSFTTSMSNGKWLHTATRLNDGRVLVVGGEHYSDPQGPHFRITEYYNPATATWSAGPLLNTGRADHEAALLPDGRLMVAGGVNGWLVNSPVASTEILNGSSWQPGPSMSQGRVHFSLVVMSDGGLLVSGGTTLNSNPQTQTAGAERYDPVANAWTPSGVMNAQRRFHMAIQLADGRVLVAGGQDGSNPMASSEIMGDGVAPQTTATRSIGPNGNGWNNGNVTITLDAADNDGGSGVQSIVYSLAGAQTGGATVSGSSASVVISAEGTSTLAYHAKDVAGNVEADQTLLVRIDRTSPILANQPNVTTPATAGGTVIAFNPSATDGLSGVVSVGSSPLSSGMRFPAGMTTVQLTALDAAGNAATTSFTVTIVPSAPIVTVTGGDFVADGNMHPASAIARDSSGAAVAGTVNFAYAPGGSSAPSAPGNYSAAATFISSDPGILSAFPWTTRARDPRANTSPTVVALNGKLYVHGFDSDTAGNQGSFVPRLSIYDPASNSWTIGASPSLIRAGVSMGVINGKIYVAGGCIMSDCRIGITNALEIYDPVANSWSNGAPMATGRLGAAAGVIGGRFYVTGGILACPPCDQTSVTEIYDPVSNTWTSGAPIPVPHGGAPSAVVNNLLYVIGGIESTGAFSGRVDVYDPAGNIWTSRAPMPTARYFAAVGVINGTIHVAGGQGSTLLATNESYDPQSNTWTPGPPMLTARTASAGVVDSKLYVVGGNPRGTTEVFDPSLTARIVISAPLNHAPSANAGGPYFADEGAAVTLNGSGSSDADAGDSIVQYSWSIDNGPPVSGVNPTVTVVAVGFHSVSLTVTDTFGATSSASTTLTLYNNVPAARLSVNPNPAACSQYLTFDGSASRAGRPDRSIVSYAWDFGDGTPVVSGGASSANHAYGAFGSYTATLTVTDNNVPAKTAATSLLVIVNQGNQPPTANHGGPYAVDLGSAVQLNGAGSFDPNASCGDSIASYAWTIDGTLVLNGVSPTLTAAQINTLGVGPHNVSLTVTDESGLNNTAATTLSIYRNVPTASFTANPNPVSCTQVVSFNAFGSSAGRPDRQIVNYSWNFGDGSTLISGGSSSLNHGYGAYGSYTATLTVTDNNTPPKSASTSIIIVVSQGNQAPQANPGGPYSVNAGSPVQLNGAGSSDPNAGCGDSIVSYAWTIDGTIQLSGPSPMLDTAGNSLAAGSHSVSLRVTDEFGVSGTSSTTLNVQPVIVSVSVSPSTVSLSPGQNQTFQAIGHYSDGTTRMLPSGSGGGGNSGGTFGPGKPRWSVNFTPSMINVSACATAQSPAPINFSSQTIADTNGAVHETWSPGTPVITVDGSINASTVALTLLCTTSPVSGTITAQWTGTKYEGTFSFNGGASTGRVELTGWSRHAAMPVARFSLAAAASGGIVYAIGGIGPDAWSSSVDAYNPATNSWTTVGRMVTPRTGAGAVTVNGKIYVVGGHVAGGIASGIIEAYNPSSNTWDTTLTPMPTPRSHLAVVTDGVNVYAIGGDTSGNNGGAVSTVERYDPSLNSWSTLASMPSPGNFIVAGVLNDAIVVAGSGGSDGPSSATDVYEIATNTWRAGPPMPAARTLSAAGVANGGLYVVGGTVNGLAAYDAWVYYPASNSRPEGWAGVGPMLSPRSQLAAAVVGDVIYVLGGMVPGSNPTTPVADNETLSTPPFNTYAVGGGSGGSGGGQVLPTVQWQSTNTFVAGVDASGSARANALGQTTIVAVLSNGMSCVSSSTCATLTVVDTQPPYLGLSNDQTRQATGAAGALVTFFASANDNVDGQRPVTCAPPSGSMFALGATTVICSASDLSGNTATGSFVITVVDTNAPFMSTPSGNQIRQATSPAGALVTYTATANDSVDGPRPVSCNPPSGSPFPFGPTPVTCSASDTRGNTATRTFFVIVQDTIAPFLNVPFQPFSRDATSAAGAVVTFGGAVSAFDGVDGAITPSCTPSSGSTFRIGSTTVTCQATDAHGNQSPVRAFTVIIEDRPVVSAPADIVAEATSAAGAMVPFVATASSFADGALPVRCLIITGFAGGEPQFGAPVASGAAFPLGATTVGCLATSSTNSTEGDLFTITVVDTTAPALALPPGVITNATSVTGAVVAFGASAMDLVGGARPVVCSPAAGSAFVIGVTRVTCTSADALGNSATGVFTVTVLGASQILSGISAEILVIDFQQSTQVLQNVVKSINAGNTGAACGQLGAFISQVQAAAGKKLTQLEADGLIKMATDAKAAIGCP